MCQPQRRSRPLKEGGGEGYSHSEEGTTHVLGSREFLVGFLRWRANEDSHQHFVDREPLKVWPNNLLQVRGQEKESQETEGGSRERERETETERETERESERERQRERPRER
jgi:hypothetical protein